MEIQKECEYARIVEDINKSEYDDACECNKIVEDINESESDDACEEWKKISKTLKNSYALHSNAEKLVCSCPSCGKIICSRCS